MKLEDLGWAEPLQSAFVALPDHQCLYAARVSAVHRDRYSLLSDRQLPAATLSGRLRHAASDESELPTVGDWVATRATEGDDSSVITALLPRKSALVRSRPDRPTAPQLLAANLDFVFVLCALDQDFNLRRLERYLSLIWSSGAQPVVLLSKADLCPDVTGYRDRAASVALGAPVHALCALDGSGLQALTPYLARGQTIGLVGSSGVGKSTLANTLLGEERLATASVSDADGRGRHTTSHRELFVTAGGALLIDTPGMREVAMWDSADGIEATFEDVEALAQTCRFGDCSHLGEPGCGLLAAIERGELSAQRHRSYLKLLREAAYVERRVDERAKRHHAQQMRRVFRARKKMLRRSPKH